VADLKMAALCAAVILIFSASMIGCVRWDDAIRAETDINAAQE
jgi:hypothetical protein